jgi:hypothetical protein
MRYVALIVAAALGFGEAVADPSLSAEQQAVAVEHAKRLPASSVDDTLPAIPLSAWLRETIGVTDLEWFISDCDLRSTGRQSPKERLLCVGARAPAMHPVSLRFHLVVGNWAEGVSGGPYMMSSFVTCNPVTVDTLDAFAILDRLRALPEALARLRGTCFIEGRRGRRTKS